MAVLPLPPPSSSTVPPCLLFVAVVTSLKPSPSQCQRRCHCAVPKPSPPSGSELCQPTTASNPLFVAAFKSCRAEEVQTLPPLFFISVHRYCSLKVLLLREVTAGVMIAASVLSPAVGRRFHNAAVASSPGFFYDAADSPSPARRLRRLSAVNRSFAVELQPCSQQLGESPALLTS